MQTFKPLSLIICIVVLIGVSLTASVSAQDQDTTLAYGTYLGAAGSANSAVALEINPAQELVVAVNSGEMSEIRRYSGDGLTLLSSTDVGGTIHDMDVNRSNGDIAVVGDSGLKVYDATAATEDTARSKTLSDGDKRVAISSDGLIVTSAGDAVTLWSADGAEMSSTTPEGNRHVYDVAISAEHGKVYIGGYRQASANYQSPFLYAYNNDLSTLAWKAYDYWKSLVDAAKPYALTSDSRLYRIAVGRDGGLYIAGEAHGGVTVFKTDGTIPASENGADLSYIAPVEIDNWNKMHNTNAAVKTFFGKVNHETGVVERGQFILPRWDKDGNPGAGKSSRNYRVRNGSITADEQGNVYIGASAGTYIKGRFEGTLSINGEPVGAQPESDKEMAIYSVDPTFATRHTWAVLTRDQGDGSVTGFAAASGIVAFVGTSDAGELFTTTNAERTTSYNGANADVSDAYFGVLVAGSPATAVGLERVEIDGPTTGTTGEAISFTAQATPEDTPQPIEYTWSVDGAEQPSESVALTSTLTYTWETPGEKRVTVTAIDAEDNQQSTTHTIEIAEPEPAITVDAGADQTVTYSETVTLEATGTNIERYEWQQLEGETLPISPTNQTSISFTAPVTDALLTFEVTAFGESDTISATDAVTVSVQGLVADARLGSDMPDSVGPGDTITLDGTQSRASGEVVLEYEWSQKPQDVPQVSWDDRTSATPTITVPMTMSLGLQQSVAQSSDLTFNLTVTNTVTLETARDSLTIQFIDPNAEPEPDPDPEPDTDPDARAVYLPLIQR